MNNINRKRFSEYLNLFFILSLFFFLSPQLIFSQTTKQKNPPHPSAYHEVQDDAYVPDLRESQKKSSAYNYRMTNIMTKQVNVDQNGLNIIGDAANEPSIAVDLSNPVRMAIGWRQFNSITSNFRQAGYGFTTNAGMSWNFPGVINPGVFRSDPVLDVDNYGNFYYNSLTNTPTYLCHVYKSSTGGSSWGTGVYAQGGDKQWMTIDKTDGPGSGHIYSQWTSYYSVCDPGFFTRSTNYGISFEPCVQIPNEPYWGTLAVGPQGELYMGGTTGWDFLVTKSVNAKDSNQTVAWNQITSVNLDGTLSMSEGPNPGGLLGQTNIAVDTSGGPYHGNVYLLASVNRNSNSDPLDIMFARSTNGGLNFSSPVRINDDLNTTAYQWFGTMSVAPNGRIDVVWLDTRDNPGTFLSALYYSKSNDGGLTWSANQRLSEYFDPHIGWPQQNKMGDYFDMVSVNEGAHLAWAATFTGGQDVYYSYITDSTIVPVELLSFSASSASGVVNLEWSTATEINNRGFEIQRSNNNSHWKTIAFKSGAGTTSEVQRYTYADAVKGEAPSLFYYRLKQLDYDGTFEYSDIIEVQMAPEEFRLAQNYPNPFNPVTVISYQIPVSGFVTLKVYDVLGKEVASLVDEQKTAGKYEVEFNSSGLGTGVYFYTLKSGSSIATKKMILMK